MAAWLSCVRYGSLRRLKSDSGRATKVIGFGRNGDRLVPESLIGFARNG